MSVGWLRQSRVNVRHGDRHHARVIRKASFEGPPEETSYLEASRDTQKQDPIRFSDWRRLFAFRATWAC